MTDKRPDIVPDGNEKLEAEKHHKNEILDVAGMASAQDIQENESKKTFGFNKFFGDKLNVSVPEISTIKGLLGDTQEKVSSASTKIADMASEQAKNYQVSEKIDFVRGAVDEYTPKEVKKTINAVSGSIDVVSGAKLIEEVREMISLQEEYNDILATKLEESLERITVLEAMLLKRDNNEH